VLPLAYMGRRPRVLAADDDPQLLEAVSEALTSMGAEVVRAENDAKPIERLADEGPFDLVVTDITMPWMSGLQAVHSARAAGVGTAVIVMTGHHEERIPAQVRALGQNAVLLHKPFELSELEAAASRLLSSNHHGA
jgi:DNA-binding response OmpR family regulator